MQEADFMPLAIIKTWERSQEMDFTYPLNIERFRFLLPYPKEESRLTAIYRPFTWSVSICLISYSIAIRCYNFKLMNLKKIPN